jgi:hypothetical protein
MYKNLILKHRSFPNVTLLSVVNVALPFFFQRSIKIVFGPFELELVSTKITEFKAKRDQLLTCHSLDENFLAFASCW